MSRMPNFHSVDELQKPSPMRVYHNNDACLRARNIPLDERRSGTGGYELCCDCAELNSQELERFCRGAA